MNITNLRDELNSILVQCDDAVAKVDLFSKSCTLDGCSCRKNQYAHEEYAFIVGYTKMAVERLLRAMEGVV